MDATQEEQPRLDGGNTVLQDQGGICDDLLEKENKSPRSMNSPQRHKRRTDRR